MKAAVGAKDAEDLRIYKKLCVLSGCNLLLF